MTRLRGALVALTLLAFACAGDGLSSEQRARFEEAERLAEQGLLRRAVAELEGLRQAAPEHLPARVLLARMYAQLGNFAHADTELAFVLQHDSDYAAAHALRGRVEYLKQRPAEARAILEAAAARFPDSDEVLRELASFYAELGDSTRALATFERLHAARDALPYATLVAWGIALEAAGRGDEARGLYESALLRAPERSAEAFARLGSLLTRNGTREDAQRGAQLLEEALRRQPGEPDVLQRAGIAFLSAGRAYEARNVLQRACNAARRVSPERDECGRLLEVAEAALPVAAAPAQAPNIVLVVIDTLRRDHVGAYGYPRATTPVLDRLAGEGVVIDDAVSQAPWTAASIATMFTGLYPSAHGLDGGVRWGVPRGAAGGALRFAIQKSLVANQVTLAEVLRRNGYRTAGFVSNTYVNSIFGLAQGFELYRDEHEDYSLRTGIKRRADATNALVFEWLRQSPAEPFFLFVHYNDPHLPYDPPAPHGRAWFTGYTGRLKPESSGYAAERQGAPADDLTAEDLAYLTGLYDGEIHFVDEQLGRLVDRLAASKRSRSTLTIVTSDHGEEFRDHGSMSHGYTLYEEQLRVPLVLHDPRRLRPNRVQGAFPLLDLAPTILGLAGIRDGLPDVQGADRSALVRGEGGSAASFTFSEATYAKAQRALRRPAGTKLIDRPDGEPDLLFDLARDPRETTPLGAHPDEAALRRALADWADANLRLHEILHRDGRTGEVVLDDETIERLRSLGYIQ